MLKTKQLVGEEHSLVNKHIAKPLNNDTYRELIYRRSIQHSDKFNNYEKWNKSSKLRTEGKAVISRNYEKLHGENNLLPISFLRKGNEKSNAVCRIVTPSGFGTGFLIPGGFILTNNHVIDNENTAQLSNAEFFYEEGEDIVKVHLKPEEVFITNANFDYTIVACQVDEIKDIKPIELTLSNTNISRNERVSIIQHPRGRKKEVALQDNKVVYVYDLVIHYNTDTEPGTSGSPVFNKDWDLVALHHAGWYEDEGKTAINEGILISTIIADLRKQARSNTRYSISANKIMNSIDTTSPILGFFDVNGLVDYVDRNNTVEVEIPSHRGDKQFADIGFWNIEHFNNTVSNDRVKQIAKVIRSLSLDVFGLVEVEDGALERLVHELRRMGMSYKFVYLDAQGPQDIAILYDEITTEVKFRRDINDKYAGLLAEKTSRGKSAFPRKRYPLFAECKIKENNKETKFLMAVVHLKAFGDSISRSRRKLASEILAVIIDDIRRNENIPIVLGGDFNQKLDNSGVLNSLTKAPDLFALTLDDSQNNAITYVGNSHRSLIDHIIVSKDIKLGDISNDDAAIVRLDKNVAKYTHNISDHVPVVCRIIYDIDHQTPEPINHKSTNLDDDFQLGKLSAHQNKNNEYYNEKEDKKDIKTYYKEVAKDDFSTNEAFFALTELVSSTHINRYSYRTARLKYLYPIVDVRENGKLKSIYKNAETYFEVEEVLERDYKIESELIRRSGELSEEQLEKLEGYTPYNCEHVVCQSWFNKREPMKSDLHHLFTCESGCNSSRGNRKYVDLPFYNPDVKEALRAECGFGQKATFEPESGKGAVARATLYFLIRYPRVITRYEVEDLQTLLSWHQKYPVSLYEKHRNREIYKIQGNRNPFIDFPEKCMDINIELGIR